MNPYPVKRRRRGRKIRFAGQLGRQNYSNIESLVLWASGSQTLRLREPGIFKDERRRWPEQRPV